MGAYDSLLAAIGFPAADAAQAINTSQQQYNAKTAQLNFQGGLDRNSILSNQEGNGVLSSGETGTKIANQATQQSYSQDVLSADNAANVAAQQAAVNQAKAQAQAQAAALAQQAAEFNQQIAEQQAAQQASTQVPSWVSILYPGGVPGAGG